MMTAPVSDDALIAELREAKVALDRLAPMFAGPKGASLYVTAADRLAELLAERTAILSGAGSIVSTVTDAAEQSLAAALERERGLREELEQVRARKDEARGLIRDLTTVLEKRNNTLAALRADAERMRVALREAETVLTKPSDIGSVESIRTEYVPLVSTIRAAIAKGGGAAPQREYCRQHGGDGMIGSPECQSCTETERVKRQSEERKDAVAGWAKP